MPYKYLLKQLLGELPLTAELYWFLRQSGQPLTANFSFKKLETHLPTWTAQARANAPSTPTGRHILIFATLRYWIEYATLLGLSLAGLGHRVSLAFLPYGNWKKPLNRFDLRQQNAYAQNILRRASPPLQIVPLYNGKKDLTLPPPLEHAIRENAWRDTQYTLQVEEVDAESALYKLRLERDAQAAQAALQWIRENRPDLVIIPNGSILEFGAFYQAARYLNQTGLTPLTVITYEFGEQRQRIWLARNGEVMRQDTDELWRARKDQPLSEEQVTQIRDLFAARQRASLWENFARRWQGVPGEGGEKARSLLGLDHPGSDRSRPVVLLATNVIGDSLTLGRQVFSDSMTEWLKWTVRYFASRSDVQLIIRIHPGELITKGPSVASLVQHTLAELPGNQVSHIHLVPADAKVNTYDLFEIADLGLVYTTTVGMEMAMSGLPVIVVGQTHYRGKGFTLDPDTWQAYHDLLISILATPHTYRLTQSQVELAWNYAYRFFFEYPHPFPWHLLQFWKDQEDWPLARVLDKEGQSRFGETFRILAGEPIG